MLKEQFSWSKISQRIKHASVIKSASIYTMGNIVNAAIPFFLMPVLTRYLVPVDYGITAMLGVLMGVFTPFIGLNLQGAISVYYFKENINFTGFVSNCIILLLLSSIGVSFIAWVFAEQISYYSSFPIDWLWSVIVLCFSNFFIMLVQTIQQVRAKAKQYIILQISQTLINVSLSVFLVVAWGMNWQGRILAQAIVSVIFFVVSVVLLRKWDLLHFYVNHDYIKIALRFGIPLIPHALSGWFVLAADRFFITNMIGLADVGIFSVGYQLGMAIELIGMSVNKAFSPWLYRQLKDITEAKKVVIVRNTYCFAIGFFCFAVLYALVMPSFLSGFLGEKFQQASDYIMGFAIASAINAMYYMVVNYIFYVGKTNILAGITFSTGIIHIGVTYSLIKLFGAVGASYAAVITGCVSFLLTWYLSNKVYDMPWLRLRYVFKGVWRTNNEQ